jgi:hypothetical protein
MVKGERRALKIVLSKNILPVLVAKNINFSVVWHPSDLRVKIPKNALKMLRRSNEWFSGVRTQKSVLSITEVNLEDGSPERKATVSGKLYISYPDIVLILTAKLKQAQ